MEKDKRKGQRLRSPLQLAPTSTGFSGGRGLAVTGSVHRAPRAQRRVSVGVMVMKTGMKAATLLAIPVGCLWSERRTAAQTR